ncbi:MAG: indolepyruvate ferredoxin oxidoreductase subunit beta [Aquificota bacterium]|nr:MAG: indolepyruvate ferredoxin oxidoreductase subunit beta [Aquificota bacterium]
MTEENLQMVVTGLGGQGVILLTRIIGQWALLEGHGVLATETHGMATRGGSVTAHIKIGQHHFPLVAKGNAQVAIALAPGEEGRAKEYLTPQGILLTNREGEAQEKVWPIQATRIATEELGSPLFANLIMLGVLGRKILNTPRERLLEALKEVTNPKYFKDNSRALELGYKEAGNATT